MGLISDKAGRKLTAAVGAVLMAGALFWAIRAQELWMFFAFAFVFGFAYSGFATALGALIGDIFGMARIGMIFGALEMSFGIGAAAGPLLGGLVFDTSGSYSTAFLTAALLMLIAAAGIGFSGKRRVY